MNILEGQIVYLVIFKENVGRCIFTIFHNKMGNQKGEKQSRFSARELTVNCMSLSLLVEDLDEKGLVAGKQTNHMVNTTREFMSTI